MFQNYITEQPSLLLSGGLCGWAINLKLSRIMFLFGRSSFSKLVWELGAMAWGWALSSALP
jgi:hypothetical protein